MMLRIGVVLAAVCGLWGQVGGQYPPGQYPPGQYPPGQYPPGQYPNDPYPRTRTPGGLPVPDIKWPRRQPKESGSKITVAAVDGTLRNLGQKDLLVQVKRDVLRFRLLAKTQFRDRRGDPIRDSLLNPGDQISVQVNPDDEETAVRVILMRSGSDADRRSAELPPQDGSVRAPRSGDFGKPRTVNTGRPDQDGDEPARDDAEPTAAEPSPTVPGPPAGPGPTVEPAKEAGPPVNDAELLAQAREAAGKYTESLSNFAVERMTTRYFSTAGPKDWQVLHETTAELLYSGGKEEVRSILIDGRPPNRPVDEKGTISLEDFGSALEDVMAESTDAEFRRRGEARVGSRRAIVYDFTVSRANSRWVLAAPDGRRHPAAYRGAVWIDAASRRVVRLEQRAVEIPADFPVSHAETIVQFGFVRMGGAEQLMPAGGENIGCTAGSGACTRSVTAYRNFRR